MPWLFDERHIKVGDKSSKFPRDQFNKVISLLSNSSSVERGNLSWEKSMKLWQPAKHECFSFNIFQVAILETNIFLPNLALTQSLSIDGAACFIIFCYMETQDHSNFQVRLHFLMNHLMLRGRKIHLNIAAHYDDSRNQTQAASTASE